MNIHIGNVFLFFIGTFSTNYPDYRKDIKEDQMWGVVSPPGTQIFKLMSFVTLIRSPLHLYNLDNNPW
jgi:hypothetical protein